MQSLYILAVLLVVIISIPISFQLKRKNDPVKLGVSFSVKYANELRIDWERAYLALLDEVEVKHLRLMSYWDDIEPNPGEYNFDDLDWQIDQAEAHNVEVTLAVGQRQPRWPECHPPEWAKQIEDDDIYHDAVLQYVSRVVDRYKDSPAVTSYQVENEAANALFGDCRSYDPDFLTQEIQTVKNIDPDALVITNVSNQSGTPLRGPVNYTDKVGFSIYKAAHFEALGNQYGWSFWYVPSQWHSLRAALVEGLTGNESIVHELQAEPWGPEATVNLTLEEQNKTMNRDRLVSIVEFAKQTGMREIYLWGGEWWYWRKTEFNDKELWQTVKDLYQKENATLN